MRSRLSVRVARCLLRFYPVSFRSRFGAEVESALREAEREPARTPGLRLVVDSVATLARAWMVRPAFATGGRAGRARIAGEWRGEIAHVARSLVRNPLHGSVAVLTLALAIGANAAVFQVVHAVLLRALPYPEPERIVRVEPAPIRFMADGGFGVSSTLTEVAQVEAVASFTAGGTATFVADGNAASAVRVAHVSRSFFAVLGSPLRLGAGFSESGDGGHEAILGHGIWLRAFGGDASVIGRTIHLSGHAIEVAGVAGPDVAYPAGTEIWITYPAIIGFYGGALTGEVIARVARVELLDEVRARHEELVRTRYTARGDDLPAANLPRLVPLRESLVGSAGDALTVLLAASTLVLLLGCVNLTGLFLARHASRAAELAVRRALGAGRARLMRMVFTESLLVSLFAGAVSVAVAFWGWKLLTRLLPPDLPGLSEGEPGLEMLGFVAAASVVTGLMIGVIPAVQAGAGRYAGEAGRLAERRRRLHPALVVSEIALAVVLVAGAGLLGRSVVELRSVPLGYDLDGVLTFEVRLPVVAYTAEEARTFPVFAEDVRARLTSHDGVISVGYGSVLPLGEGLLWAPRVWADSRAEDEGAVNAPVTYASDDFLGSLGVPLIAGAAERIPRGSVVVSRSLGLALFGREDIVGERVRVRFSFNVEPETRTIAGVTGNVRPRGFESEEGLAFYLPFDERPQSQIAYAIRLDGDPTAFVHTVRRVVAEVHPAVAPTRIQTTRAAARSAIATREALALVSALFGLGALMLAALGIYGLIAQDVIRRRREMGIRMAVGARSRDVLTLVLTDGFRLAIAGIAIGLLSCFALMRLIGSFLWGIGASDPFALTFAAAILLLATAAACAMPAFRAARVDPVDSLRSG